MSKYKKIPSLFLIVLFILIPSICFADENTFEFDGYQANVAAAILRNDAAVSENQDLYDYTGNGTVNENDAKGILLQAAKRVDGPQQLRSTWKNSILSEDYLDLFSYNQNIQNGYDYTGSNVCIRVTENEMEVNGDPVVYFVADIYITNLNCLKVGFARSGKGKTDQVEDMARQKDALIAINGDFYSRRGSGIIIRNGEVLRNRIDKTRDLGVLTYDGILHTFEAKTYAKDDVHSLNPYQSWCFGPTLLDENGIAKTSFVSSVSKNNPRAVIGYYEPGHYCFVVVDGRNKNYSYGLSLENLAKLMQSLGCKVAYNLDGGATAVMANATEGMINSRTDDDRECSDIIYIIDRYADDANSQVQLTDSEIGEEIGQDA